MADDECEVGLPQKGLNLIIKEVIPDVRIANESRDLLNQCCVEFIKHLSVEAQRISAHDRRKTIYHEHVQKGLNLCNRLRGSHLSADGSRHLIIKPPSTRSTWARPFSSRTISGVRFDFRRHH
jgi:histone H3/H4